VKRHFYRQLRFEVRRAQEAGERLALLMMDMDGLKAINDANGHSYGAFVISQVGRLIGEVVGPVGQACRYGGDEFVAYLQNHDLKMAMAVGERIRATVQEHLYEKDGKTLRVTISIGASEMSKEVQDPDALNKAADEALYRAKAKGRNRVSD
jgi:diguanylate cyclase (GGDEF)-like protein